MAKTRVAIPKAISEAVLKEFNHKCAICGKERPQIHHIDENPSNNETLNLIPLCPNCHLVDQHNPTQPIDSIKLRFFREFKDPCILKPQFDPLFTRLKRVAFISDEDGFSDLINYANELCEFISYLEMGGFYSSKISRLIKYGSQGIYLGQGNPKNEHVKYINQIGAAREPVTVLIVELLRYQRW